MIIRVIPLSKLKVKFILKDINHTITQLLTLYSLENAFKKLIKECKFKLIDKGIIQLTFDTNTFLNMTMAIVYFTKSYGFKTFGKEKKEEQKTWNHKVKLARLG